MNHTTPRSPARRPNVRLHLTKESLRRLNYTAATDEPHKEPSYITLCTEGTANCAGTNLNCMEGPARPRKPADHEGDAPPPPKP